MKRLEHVNFSLWDVKYCTNVSYQLTDIHKYPNVIENFCNSVIGYSGVSWIVKDIERLIAEDERIKKDIEIINSHLKV